MKSGVSIRPLKQQDEIQWRRLWTAYMKFYDTALDEEVYKTSFARLLSKDAGEYNCLMAEIAGEPVGLAHFLYHRFMWSVEDTCYLMDLFVDPEARGNGVGRALIEAVHKTAKDDGVPSTYWTTQEFNYKGRMLYDQVATRMPYVMYVKEN